MTFRSLSAHLVPTAELVLQEFLKGDLGLTRIAIETAIHREIEFRPTLSARRRDHHYICVEVSESPMPSTIPAFILECQHKHYPVLLYIAYPAEPPPSDLGIQIRRARDSGVGIISVEHDRGTATVLNTPLSLSLTGLRRSNKKNFPSKYREQLVDAENTFLNGNPNKGCAMVYDEIESLTRRIAIKTEKKGYWRKSLTKPRDLEAKMPWKSVTEGLIANLDLPTAKVNGHNLDSLPNVLNQVLGTVPDRNASSHKPRSLRALCARDTRLRTRMEGAIDTLEDLITASRCLRV